MTAFVRTQSTTDLPPSLKGGVVAIGNFDGLHRGHQAVLGETLEIASEKNAPAVVLTFEPHPKTVFRPDNPVFRLTPAPLKAHLLERLGFAAVVEMPFDRTFAAIEAADFIEDILVDGFGLTHAVTGFNFHFGKARAGTPDYLREAGKRLGFGVTEVESFSDENDEVVSSSRIRQLLSEGRVAEASGLLGYHYTVEEEVVGGKKLGRTLGFPTANMRLPDHAMLKPGVYAVRFRRSDGALFDGVASFGRRPTVDKDGALLLETYLFDFEGDLYGETCSVSFVSWLRGEEKFDGLEALTQQMTVDAEEARAALSGVRHLGPLDITVPLPG